MQWHGGVVYCVTLALFWGCGSSVTNAMKTQTTNLTPPSGRTVRPKTDRQDFVETIHTTEVPDPYRWLEDISSPKVKAWVDAQDAYAQQVLSAMPERDKFLHAVNDLLYVEESFAPTFRSDRVFYKLQPKDEEKPIHYWRDLDSPAPHVLLDPNRMTGNVSVSVISPSWDGRLVAYVVSENNKDWGAIKVRRVDDGVDLPDCLTDLFLTEVAWAPDNTGFYYVWYPDDKTLSTDHRFSMAEIRFHRIGTAPSRDEKVLGPAGDPSRWYDVAVSDDRRYLFITAWFARSSTEVYYSPLGRGPVRPEKLIGSDSAHFFAASSQGNIYVLTDDEAPRGRVLRYDVSNEASASWTEVVPEDPEATLEEIKIVGSRMALRRVWRARSEIEIRRLDGRLIGKAVLPTIGRVTEMYGSNCGGFLFVTFESYDRPRAALRISLDTLEVSHFHDTGTRLVDTSTTVEQVEFQSKDGTRVPMFVVRPTAMKQDGENPTILFGYGAFGISRTPRYNPLVIAWVRHGGVYAVANIRGGGEFGQQWHRAGMLQNKQNTIDDFIGAAEWLIRHGYTKPERLAIRGGSGGGVAIGGAMTQRPELFGAVVCIVPILDMLRHHKSGTAKRWIPEYGNPDDPTHFQWLISYSPYHHIVRDADYPALLMISADEDERVDPMHARKFVAALQWALEFKQTRVLLRTQRNAGHLGGDLRWKRATMTAEQLAFVHSEIGRN